MFIAEVFPPPIPLSALSESEAEARFNFLCKEAPNTILLKILDLVGSSPDSNLRFHGAYALRYLLHRHILKLWPRFHPRITSRLKEYLININFVTPEKKRCILEQLRGALIALGSYLLPDDPWPELISLLYPSLVSTSARVRGSALFIFSNLAELIVIEPQLLHPHLSTLRSMIGSSLVRELNGLDIQEERNAALLAAITLNHLVPPSEDCKMFQDLLPYMISVLLEAFTGNQQELVKEAVKRLTLLIAVEPKYICPCLPAVVEAMLQIAEFEGVDEELRCRAVNLVVTLAKTREKEPVMVEQHLVPVLERFVAILLQMLSDMEDDEDKDTGEENNFYCAKIFSNALSAALGGDLLVPVLIRLLPAYLTSSDWKERHAALFFLKEIAEGCAEAMKENLEQFKNKMVQLLNDNHPRVKWAALIAMHVLLVDLKPNLEAQYRGRIFPILILQAVNTFNRSTPLLQPAQSDSELTVSSTNMDNIEVKTGKDAGEKVLDEKALACNMLCCYADELKEDFHPWITQVALVLLPLLKIKFHKKVRKAAISAMSKLLCSAKLVVEKGEPCEAVKHCCAKMIPNSLIKAMHEEDDIELCCEMVKSLVDCIQVQFFH
ncbi:importin-5-like protein [Carex littledalei]|uniref:Importin-5-like protein n=1 Tax=Carex littledalei TaxID=544730 RepID=A0A833RAS0_9POAL|nr:importin-5-like protein [Carex littledalei]